VPLHVIDQVLIIYAGTRGHLDKIPIKDVQAWEKQFLTFIHHQKPEIWDELDKKKDLTDELAKKIEAAIKEFQAQYASGEAAKKKPEAPKREPVAV
jgi:F-type H+-transporting ATPase subunit alpha